MPIEIQLTRGYVTVVDDEDADLAELRWCVRVSGGGGIYAARHTPRRSGPDATKTRLSRVITERIIGRPLAPGEMAEHRDGDRLNNRRANLRVATNQQNQANVSRPRSDSTTGFRGVSKRGNRYRAHSQVNGKTVHLGTFDTPQEAHEAYKAFHRETHGDFSPWKETGVIHIHLSGGQIVTVDEIDSDLAELRWNPLRAFRAGRELIYATRNASRRNGRKPQTILLSRVIVGRMLGRPLGPDELAEHRDGDTLNNRRSNLRVATRSQNGANNRKPQTNNTTGFRGVCRYGNRFVARAKLHGVQHHIGTFDTPEEAHEAYKAFHREAHGPFSPWALEGGD